MSAEEIRLTSKQAEYVREAHHRWNFAVGAVRSGKSHLAVRYTIPRCLRAGHNRRGLNLILGATKENVERNVLEPMRDMWGQALVGDINSRNWATVFGEKVYCIGGENVKQVNRIRGSEIKFCYVDEVCDVHPQVFEMLKSRLSLPYSECHAACNPAGPTHFVKRFLDQGDADPDIDLWHQEYAIWDNPFLPDSYVRALEAEYRGTVYYDRYILGRWVKAEGLVYPMWEQALEDTCEYTLADGTPDPGLTYCVSVDYGTQNAFAALLWVRTPDGTWHAVREFYYSGRREGHQRTDEDYCRDLASLCEGLPRPAEVIVDPSATSFITALRRALNGDGHQLFRVRHARNEVADGIRDTATCLQTGRVRISRELPCLAREFAGYVWDDSEQYDRPVKADDHLMDALRYMVRTKRAHRPQGAAYESPFESAPDRALDLARRVII